MALVLAHTPGEWDGMFALTVEFMVTDLLTNGPIEVTVNGEEHMLVRYGNGVLVYENGSTLNVLCVDKIEIP